jgi:acyl-CoA thioesterase-2
MNDTLSSLVESLKVETLDRYLYRGTTHQPTLPRIYGGQVIAQSLNAALRTVDSERIAHSLHAYFLRPGDPERPVLYEVDPIRDGGHFTTRRVVARQNGEAIFNCSLSFQVIEQGFEHQAPMPDLPRPEQLESLRERLLRADNGHTKHALGNPDLFAAWDIRHTLYPDFQHPGPCKLDESYGIWFRLKGDLPEDTTLHQTLLAYISDLGLALTAAVPHPIQFHSPDVQGASLDHAMWFHSPHRVDRWVAYACDSPRAIGARGLSRGSFFTGEGELVASTAQEVLMRVLKSNT